MLTQPAHPILLVDDKIANLVSLEAALNQLSYPILTASSGEQALSLLLDRPVALVLLDIQMPGMDGHEVARLLQQHPHTRHIPLIFMSAVHADADAVRKSFAHGAIDFISKPIDSTLLLSKVGVLLEKEQQRQQLLELNQLLQQERTFYSSILATTAEGILVLSPDGLITYANPAACRLLGTELAQLTNQPWLNWIRCEPSPTSWQQSDFYRSWQLKLTFNVDDLSLLRDQYGPFPVALSCAPLSEPNQGLVVAFQDISAAKLMQQQLQQQALTDPLTGLLNRQGYLQALELAIARVDRNHQLLAVFFLDLNDFKRINDTFGHQAGDALLRGVAQRLRHGLRPYDQLARLGGDEFTILVDSLDSAEDAALIAENLIEHLAPPHEINQLHLSVGVSIGIAIYPECASNLEKLLQAADLAMYRAKTEGHNQYRFYTLEMNGRARARRMLEDSLRKAIDEQQFQFFYQPQFHLKTGKIRGFEALVRWLHPRAGTMEPQFFVPMLEEAGLIHQLGPWLIHHLCEKVCLWQQDWPQPVRVTLNLSAQQFAERNLLTIFEQALARFPLAAGVLELEITESLLVDAPESSQQLLRQLSELGIRIALDHFGTGYSSLAYLGHSSLHTLKIDRRFVSSCMSSATDAAIARSIIQLGHNLGLEIVAEGVENSAQLHWLQQMDCDAAQGYLLARAMPFDEARAFPLQIPLEFG